MELILYVAEVILDVGEVILIVDVVEVKLDYSDNNATLWSILQAENCQIFSLTGPSVAINCSDECKVLTIHT